MDDTEKKTGLLLLILNHKYGKFCFNPREDSVIFKPFKRLMVQGAPIGDIIPLILNTNTNRVIENCDEHAFSKENLPNISPDDFKVLGSFCYSKGEKLLFYPSFTATYLIQYKNGNEVRNRQNIEINHFSLENNLQKWHITLENGHIHDLKTQASDENLTFWFRLSIKGDTDLEQSYIFNVNSYECPPSDIARRNAIFNETKENYNELVINTPPLETDDKGDFFWEFDFYHLQSNEPLNVNIKPPQCVSTSYISYDSDMESIPDLRYYTDLKNNNEWVVVIAKKIQGTLTYPVLIK